MGTVSRREMMGSLGTLVTAGGWLAVGGAEAAVPTASGKAYALPRLPYPYDALEPHIDAETMELHHDRHHRGYVRGLTTVMGKLEVARRSHDFSAIQTLSRAAAFHGSGHVLHSIFWENMAPDGGGKPAKSSKIARALDRDFGGFAAFAGQFRAAASSVEARGKRTSPTPGSCRRRLVASSMSGSRERISCRLLPGKRARTGPRPFSLSRERATARGGACASRSINGCPT